MQLKWKELLCSSCPTGKYEMVSHSCNIDQADGESIDFETFLQDFKIYSWEIIEAFLIYLSK